MCPNSVQTESVLQCVCVFFFKQPGNERAQSTVICYKEVGSRAQTRRNVPIRPPLHRPQSAASVYPAINTRQRGACGGGVSKELGSRPGKSTHSQKKKMI